jgi:carbon-monoxide dehydrogenase medium subunit
MNVAEAVALKAEHGSKAVYWAGGTDLYLLMERRGLKFNHCIDLSRIDRLKGLSDEGAFLRIGAMTSLHRVEREISSHPSMAIIGETIRLMCTPQTRTLATIGGNLCHAAPSADLTPTLIALDAQAVIAGHHGERTLPLADFFLHVNKTALEGAELLAEIRLPKATNRRGAAYRRVARTVVDIALVSSGVSLQATPDGAITDARIVLGAVAPTPVRVTTAERMLVGKNLSKLSDGKFLAEVSQAAADASAPITDIRGSEWYRRRMCGVLTQRAIASSAAQIREAA